ncbi:hypothetical protein OAR43_10265, partial [Gammaproteobacteria bacterium]|nr:hypothetical protein [Gammaproteobacteria bacterium]
MKLSHPYRAIWVRRGTSLVPIFPVRGFFVFFGLIIFVALVTIMAEKSLEFLSSKQEISSHGWAEYDLWVNRNNWAKIQGLPVFKSKGYEPPVPSQDRRRVLVIGDSFVWGDGIANINMIWWRQLQWELERRGYFEVDVIAAGMNAASTQDQLGWIVEDRLLDRTRPDLVLFGFVTNDPAVNDSVGAPIVRQLDLDDAINSHALEGLVNSETVRNFLPNIVHQLSGKIREKYAQLANDDIGYPYGAWEKKLYEEKNFTKYQEILEELADELKRSSIPAFFVTLPNVPSRKFEQKYTLIRDALNDVGIPLLDVLPSFLQCCESIAGRLFTANPANAHPGPRATNFYASQVVNLLETSFPDLLGLKAKEQRKFIPKVNDWMPAYIQPRQVTEDTWRIKLPASGLPFHDKLIHMPGGQPFFSINFERPVVVRRVSITGREYRDYQVWASVLDENGHFERRGRKLVGQAAGSAIKIDFPESVSSRRLTSLHISPTGAVDPGPQEKEVEGCYAAYVDSYK